MKPDPVEQELRELAWRRPLSDAERARLAKWLSQHPEARAEWEADAALSAALSKVVAQPAPSNLAARVLAEIDRDGAVPARGEVKPWLHSVWRWLPRVAVVGVVVVGGTVWFQQHQQEQESARQAEALVQLLTVAEPDAMPSVETLENFDVILKIHPASLADTELLSMSKQLAEFKP